MSKIRLDKLISNQLLISRSLVRTGIYRGKATVNGDADVQAAVKEVTDALGSDGRILVRESGTEPVIRVMVEAGDIETCQKYVDKVEDVIVAKGYLE